jgi:Carboxypeptidase regulatory-like domain
VCRVTVDDPTTALDVRVAEPALSVPPGESRSTLVHLKGPRSFFGNVTTRSVAIEVRSDTRELRSLLTFNQKPVVPRGALTALLLAGIIALWAVVFLLAAGYLRPKPPEKALANQLRPTGTLDGTALAASASGTLLSPFGQPLSRVVVEAYRVPSTIGLARAVGGVGSSRLVPAQATSPAVPEGWILAGSAATDQGGSYTISGLLPGDYRLRLSGAGFPAVWYPGVTDPASAAAIRLEPRDSWSPPRGAPPVELAGQGGSISLQVLDALGGDLTGQAQVTAVRELTEQEQQRTPPPEVAPIPFALVGDRLVATGLPTPATYQVAVALPGSTAYEPTARRQSVGAGAEVDLGQVRLEAAPGTVTGTVRDELGAPLGDVEVRVEAGGVERTARTPTEDAVGTFTITDLPTPRAYVVSFSKDGYAGVSVIRPLDPGGKIDLSDVRLVGGAGTVGGQVVDAAGTPLGGVKVTVTRGAFTAATSTLTAGNPGGFQVSGLPTPATYVLTFEKDGFATETQQVSFRSAGRAAPLRVAMRAATGSVQGTARGPDGPVADVKVVLSDGLEPRETLTASSPPGFYTFGEVPAGTYTITFTKDGLAPFRTVVTVFPPAVATSDARMDVVR